MCIKVWVYSSLQKDTRSTLAHTCDPLPVGHHEMPLQFLLHKRVTCLAPCVFDKEFKKNVKLEINEFFGLILSD